MIAPIQSEEQGIAPRCKHQGRAMGVARPWSISASASDGYLGSPTVAPFRPSTTSLGSAALILATISSEPA